jgi:prepilin-type N-terminal cleavage/methylation domain-containing protein
MQVITVNTKSIIKKSEQGFTLIELLVVIGILAILMGIVLIAINPAAQFAQANNTSRTNSVSQILNAIGQYEADNKGQLPSPLVVNMAAPIEIKNGTTADICAAVMPAYIASLPADPDIDNGGGKGAPITSCTTYDTGFKAQVDANGRVTISATAESVRGVTPVISVQR